MKKPMTTRESRGLNAFTLIELLVVIAIIGILASLIIPLSGIATTKMRIARTQAELNQFVTAIENYKLETGSYPPDSFDGLRRQDLTRYRSVVSDPVDYKTNAGMNSLFYELTGAIFTNGVFRTLAGGQEVQPNAIRDRFHVSGIQNSARNRHDIPFKGFTVKPAQVAVLDGPENLELLNVPVPGFYELKGRTKRINPWYYDASTTNRHNRSGFDLWAEIRVGNNDTNIIGNWKN